MLLLLVSALVLPAVVAPTSAAHALGDPDDIEVTWVWDNTGSTRPTPGIALENYQDIELVWTRERSGVPAVSYSTVPANDLTATLVLFMPNLSSGGIGLTSIGPFQNGDVVTVTVSGTSINSQVLRMSLGQFSGASTLIDIASAKFVSEVVSLGTLGLTSLKSAFLKTPNFQMTASLPPTVTDLQAAFQQSGVVSPGVGAWDVSQVTNLSSTFTSTDSFNEDLSGWNTSNVTRMNGIFGLAKAFNQDISGWNTSQVTLMSLMFFGAEAFNQDISGWNTSQVTDMVNMFRNAVAFNQDISGWNTSQVTDMRFMFGGATAFNQDVSGWNTSQVTKMARMFSGATSMNQDLGALDITGVVANPASSLYEMLSGSGMTDANYAATLNGWVTQPVQSGLTLSAGTKVADTCARVYAADTLGWIITDGWNTAAVDAKRTECDSTPATISWSPTPTTTTSSPFTPSPVPVTSGGPVSYSVESGSSTTSDCQVGLSSGELTYSTSGTCTVVATASATSTTYPVSTRKTFDLVQLPPANIEWSISDTQRAPAAFESPFTPPVLPSSTDGVSIAYSVVDAGTTGCTVNATTGVIGYTGGGDCTVRATTGATSALSANSLDVVFELPAPPDAPGTPSTPVATVNGGSIALSWTAPTTGGDPAGYTVTSSPAGAVCAIVGMTASCTGLTEGVSYSFTVIAFNAGGASATSASSNTVVVPTSAGGGSGGLANTGFEAQGLSTVALALLIAGAIAVLSVQTTRRRRQS
ncbi:BspA family leucine-rich repeat surface protein [Rhodoglobus vestalii]|nr:BspA family leucine-rich repeat surface protein [Rhodoglobus vestalii]